MIQPDEGAQSKANEMNLVLPCALGGIWGKNKKNHFTPIDENDKDFQIWECVKKFGLENTTSTVNLQRYHEAKYQCILGINIKDKLPNKNMKDVQTVLNGNKRFNLAELSINKDTQTLTIKHTGDMDMHADDRTSQMEIFLGEGDSQGIRKMGFDRERDMVLLDVSMAKVTRKGQRPVKETYGANNFIPLFFKKNEKTAFLKALLVKPGETDPSKRKVVKGIVRTISNSLFKRTALPEQRIRQANGEEPTPTRAVVRDPSLPTYDSVVCDDDQDPPSFEEAQDLLDFEEPILRTGKSQQQADHLEQPPSYHEVPSGKQKCLVGLPLGLSSDC